MARIETAFTNYASKVQSDAESFVSQEWDSIRQKAKDGEFNSRHSVSDVIDYNGQLHWFLDQEIDLYEAADILGQCDNVETDYGLWHGMEDPEKAVGVKAFFSFMNDVYDAVKNELSSRLEELKSEEETLLEEELQKSLDDAQQKLAELEGLMEDALEEIEENDIKLQEIEEQIHSMNELIESLEEKISDQESVISNIQDAIDTL